MFKFTALACGLLLALTSSAMANISLVSLTCSGNKINVAVRQTGIESHRVYIIANSSSAPQEVQSKLTLPISGNQNLGYSFSSNMVPFGVISVYTTNLQINTLYNGCP